MSEQLRKPTPECIQTEQVLESPRVVLMSQDLASAGKRCAQLTLAGWHTIQFIEPLETLAAVRGRDIDLVLLRIPMEDMAAMDLTNVLRTVAPAAYLPVVVLAEDPAEKQRCDFLDLGADDIIPDGTSGDEMIARLRALLRVKHLHDDLSASRAALQAALQRERELLQKVQRDNDALQVLATTDPLTHTENVRSWSDILDHEFRIARRYNQPMSLLMMDVDHFKVVNDTHGHPSGDYVLKELAVILKQSVRESDVVARVGGEEFSIILPKADRSKVRSFAERIRRSVSKHRFNVYGHDIHVSISVGSATYPQDAEITSPGMLQYVADQALLVAKETGRDRVVALHSLDGQTRHRFRRQYLAMQKPKPPSPAQVEEPVSTG